MVAESGGTETRTFSLLKPNDKLELTLYLQDDTSRISSNALSVGSAFDLPHIVVLRYNERIFTYGGIEFRVVFGAEAASDLERTES